MGVSSVDERIGAYLNQRELPRKLKKRLLGTRRQRRRFELGFIRAMSRKLYVTVKFEVVDLVVRNESNEHI